MMHLVKKYLAVITIMIIALIGVNGLFHQGFYTSHDGEHQIVRLLAFDQALKEGQFPPRWAGGSINNGYGYPLFIFSYPGPWFFGEPIRLLGFSGVDSVKATFILTYVLSGIIMFLWQKRLWGTFPGMVAATLYLWAPYRFVNIYVRASLGEAVTFLFIPLLFWSLAEIIKKPRMQWIGIGAVALTGLMISHVLIFEIFLIPLGIFLFLSLIYAHSRVHKLLFLGITFLIGFGLASYYIIPAFLEKNITQVHTLLTSQYNQYFINFSQVIYSKWGYGFDFPGDKMDGFSFQLGMAQWIVVLTSLLCIIWFFIHKKKNNVMIKDILFPLQFLSIFLFSIYMMLPMSNWLWMILTKVFVIDFPWRFLSVAVFASSCLGGYVTSKLNNKATWMILGVLLLVMYNNRNYIRVNQYTYFSDESYQKVTNTTTQYNEYLPQWVSNSYITNNKKLTEIVSNNPVKVLIRTSKSNMVDATVTLHQPSDVTINRIYYPGWKLFINNKEREVHYNSYGFPVIYLPKGLSNIRYVLTETPLRLVGNGISILSFILLLCSFLFFSKQSKK